MASPGRTTSSVSKSSARTSTRGFTFLAFQRADALLEQLAVEFKPDGGDVAALLRAEQIARAANFQIAHRDFESAAERGVLLHRADALAHVREQARVARQQQIRVSLMLVAPDAPAQLVKLAQAKTVGAVNDDGVRVRNIEAALDDRRRKQNIRLAVDEFRHHLFQIVRVHLPVADDDARVRHERFQFRAASCQSSSRGCAGRKPVRRDCISRWMASRMVRSS